MLWMRGWQGVDDLSMRMWTDDGCGEVWMNAETSCERLSAGNV